MMRRQELAIETSLPIAHHLRNLLVREAKVRDVWSTVSEGENGDESVREGDRLIDEVRRMKLYMECVEKVDVQTEVYITQGAVLYLIAEDTKRVISATMKGTINLGVEATLIKLLTGATALPKKA